MSIRPQPSKHNLREGIIKSWEYLLSKAPPEWQFSIPNFEEIRTIFRMISYVACSEQCSFQKLCSKIPEPYSFHHSWGSWCCSRDPRLVQHRGSRSGGTLIWTSSTAWGEPTEVTPLVQVKVEGPSKSFLDDRAIGTTEPWLWEDLTDDAVSYLTKTFFLHILFPHFWFDDFSVFAGYVSVPWRVYFGCGPIPVGRWLKWRFRLGFPTEPVIIMVVTVTGREPRPT